MSEEGKRRGDPRVRWLTRMLAFASTGLVLLLTVLAARPDLHERIHPDAGQPGHECVITLFAHGLELAAGALALAVVLRVLPATNARESGAPQLPRPRYFLQPGRAPPRG